MANVDLEGYWKHPAPEPGSWQGAGGDSGPSEANRMLLVIECRTCCWIQSGIASWKRLRLQCTCEGKNFNLQPLGWMIHSTQACINLACIVGVVKGAESVAPIAAASVICKCLLDDRMMELDEQYPEYREYLLALQSL
eukprot:1158662-Pelagomonas_calceolata.AAC.2